MLVAISGSQGSGKTTILNKLQQLGYNIITRKTSRSILSEWGKSLDEINNDPDLALRFQKEIIDRKFADESVARSSKDLWFTERTYADLFTYALVNLGKDNTYSNWLDSYYDECCNYQKDYSAVYYIRGGMFNVKPDGVRSVNMHFSRMVDLTMKDLTKRMLPNSHQFREITSPELEFRVQLITSTARS